MLKKVAKPTKKNVIPNGKQDKSSIPYKGFVKVSETETDNV